MIANLILIAIALFALYGITLLSLRQNLLHDLRELQRRQGVLMNDYGKRRDQVPLLLESTREDAPQPSDTWRKLVTDRTTAPELDFEKELNEFLQNPTFKSLGFLEAKKSITEISALIEKQKQEIQAAIAVFNAKRREFPYSMATTVFAFHELA